MLQEVGFNGGVPITEEFFSEKITGGHNEYLCGILFPNWDIERARQFFQDKETMYRRLVSEKVEPVKGLDRLRQWIEKQGLRRAAVTNASRLNVELILSKLKLTDFFEILLLGEECA
ncbi:haloacid dehalogenase-like hydrolase domain-containing protein Sgpp [Malus domestica]|uniref:haloacid dehalogenase-like hydrolase domain-containing protein Sgpp n=1 Tax=Malus domestica TaxID=3750 RepID=UPI0039748803